MAHQFVNVTHTLLSSYTILNARTGYRFWCRGRRSGVNYCSLGGRVPIFETPDPCTQTATMTVASPWRGAMPLVRGGNTFTHNYIPNWTLSPAATLDGIEGEAEEASHKHSRAILGALEEGTIAINSHLAILSVRQQPFDFDSLAIAMLLQGCKGTVEGLVAGSLRFRFGPISFRARARTICVYNALGLDLFKDTCPNKPIV